MQTSQKLMKKERIGSRIKRVYALPKTPYQRVMESKDIGKEIKQKLTKQFEELSPFALKRAIDKKIKLIFASVTYYIYSIVSFLYGLTRMKSVLSTVLNMRI